MPAQPPPPPPRTARVAARERRRAGRRQFWGGFAVTMCVGLLVVAAYVAITSDTDDRSSTAAATSPGDPTSWMLTDEGLGPIKLGATLDDAARRGGVQFVEQAPPCDGVAWFADGPEGVLFGVADGRIVWIAVGNPTIATDRGISNSSSTDDIVAAYPDAHRTRYDNRGLPLQIAFENGARLTITDGVTDVPGVNLGFREISLARSGALALGPCE